ncbi:MBL fold metallo-hydrolase [Allofrancisella frigidaquae]|uniref:MBL fold metallo-hydrolase n=1 Tax=Allofrancisella frigidaquae TaxID=1085644 RepID=A0A6M3HSX2_9GAMM|nr:MBL fold metallo-hydrolase [Allofrancisella frigidaquae]QIV94207.1 MBL fold metallo-hydrolase [Allofrancisella frigidaquae]
MIFRQLFDIDTFTYTYLIASGEGREAIIIDPVDTQLGKYHKLFDELDLKLVAAIDTHVHADHITALGLLRESTACKSVMGAHTKAECVSVKIKEGEAVNFDGMKLKAIYTPGHTDDSYSFILGDKLFTGDTLFVRGTGRTDFQHGDSFAQYDSINNKLFKLPDETIVYPGHDYNGFTSSTIGEEKRFNPRLQVKSAQEYAELMANLNLPNPKYMDVAVPANLKCGLVK